MAKSLRIFLSFIYDGRPTSTCDYNLKDDTKLTGRSILKHISMFACTWVYVSNINTCNTHLHRHMFWSVAVCLCELKCDLSLRSFHLSLCVKC